MLYRGMRAPLAFFALASLCVASGLVLAGCPSSETAPAPDAGPPPADAPFVLDATAPLDAPVLVDAPGGADVPVLADAPSTSDAAVLTDGGSCVPQVIDTSAIGDACTGAGDCPTGYVCQALNGIVLTHSCQIRCDESDCACPAGTVCTDHADKAGAWRQCDPTSGG